MATASPALHEALERIAIETRIAVLEARAARADRARRGVGIGRRPTEEIADMIALRNAARDPRSRDQRLCRNFLCLIASLDMHDLVEADVIAAAAWPAFRDDPRRGYLGLDDSSEAKCFALIQARMPADLRESDAA